MELYPKAAPKRPRLAQAEAFPWTQCQLGAPDEDNPGSVRVLSQKDAQTFKGGSLHLLAPREAGAIPARCAPAVRGGLAEVDVGLPLAVSFQAGKQGKIHSLETATILEGPEKVLRGLAWAWSAPGLCRAFMAGRPCGLVPCPAKAHVEIAESKTGTEKR